MAVDDFKWMSSGGLLIDGSGDIACTPAGTLDSIRDIVRSRLKAQLNGWKQYAIGADLENRLGDTVNEETELAIQRQVVRALTSDFLPAGSFQVETLPDADRIHVMVYLSGQLISKVTVNSGATQ